MFLNIVEIFNPESKYLSSWSRDACTGLHEISAINHISACIESSPKMTLSFGVQWTAFTVLILSSRNVHIGEISWFDSFSRKVSVNRKHSFLQQMQPLLTVSPIAGMLETCIFFSFFKPRWRTGKLSWADFIQVRLEAGSLPQRWSYEKPFDG